MNMTYNRNLKCGAIPCLACLASKLHPYFGQKKSKIPLHTYKGYILNVRKPWLKKDCFLKYSATTSNRSYIRFFYFIFLCLMWIMVSGVFWKQQKSNIKMQIFFETSWKVYNSSGVVWSYRTYLCSLKTYKIFKKNCIVFYFI